MFNVGEATSPPTAASPSEATGDFEEF